MPSLRIELFGSLQIRNGDDLVTSVNTNRLQSLFAFLALHAGTAQSREQLAFQLWPESNEPQARTNLRQLIHHLRRALPAECCLLTADNHTIEWRREPGCSIDVEEFDAAVARAAAAGQRADKLAERQALEKAARLYQDDLVRGLYDEWLQPKRDHYRQQLAHVLSRLAALLEELREYPAAIEHAERLIAQDPLREPHHQTLIRLHAANNDRASALRAYHQCMRTLRRELGVEPGPATRDLFELALKSEKPAETRPELPPAAVLPMVGRNAEWARLMECWREASAGRISLALILGEPGIGKSRLADELYAWCSRDGNAAVARARCYAAQGQLAYAPVVEWLRAEPLRAASVKLPRTQLAELSRVLPEFLAGNSAVPQPRPLTESWERHRFYESLNAAFVGARKPLLLMIDDLQWCDQDSFEWLHSLFRSDAAQGTLVLATVRPEETGRSHPFSTLLSELRRSGQVVELPLLPLDAGETAALASQIAGRPLERAEMAGLFKSTRGNPLFVVESVRAGPQDHSTTPSKIQAVIAARLAQLSAPAWELAGLAGVIGQSFSFDLLAKATDWDEASLSGALDELWQRRIVEAQSESSSQYDFTHDRLREVAYAELSPVRRRFLHRRVARALEELHAAEPETASGQMAAHYEAAGMAEDAIRNYLLAAAVARQRFADEEAAGLLRRAVALCREFPQTARRDRRELELLVTLGPALVTTKGYSMPEVGEAYARALTLCRRLGETEHLLPVLSGSWVFHVVRGQLEQSRALGLELLNPGDAAGNAELSLAGHFTVGSSLFHLGQLAASERHMRAALALHQGGSHPALGLFAGPDVGVFGRSYLSHLLWQLGYPDASAAASAEAIAAAHRVGHPFSLAIALDYAAMLHLFRGEIKDARARAEEAAAVCMRHDFAYYGSMAEILAGWAVAMEGGMQGDAETGLARLRSGLDALKATGAEIRLPFYHGLLAEVCALTGGTGEALANVSTGFAFQNKNGELWASAELHRIHGDILLAGGNVVQARSSYRRAIESAQLTGARMFELRASVRLEETSLLPEAQ